MAEGAILLSEEKKIIAQGVERGGGSELHARCMDWDASSCTDHSQCFHPWNADDIYSAGSLDTQPGVQNAVAPPLKVTVPRPISPGICNVALDSLASLPVCGHQQCPLLPVASCIPSCVTWGGPLSLSVPWFGVQGLRQNES